MTDVESNVSIGPVSFGEADLSSLRDELKDTMSEKRYAHTLAVEDMVARLAALYCPEQIVLLRAAALLHDITKEFSTPMQLELCEACDIPLTEADRLSPKTLHARTAAALIPQYYPRFAHETVISAVHWHTTGHAGMTLEEQLLYLADYIDETRRFPDCVRLRNQFWVDNGNPADMSPEERQRHLHRILLKSFDMTIAALMSEGGVISPDTFHIRNALVIDLHPYQT